HSMLQPSKGTALPSSHSSAPSTTPSPQTVGVHVLGTPSHLNPISTRQVGEQPSPASTPASSHCSGNERIPSPHLAKGSHGIPASRQMKPGSTSKQLAAQPSPSCSFPSSHASLAASIPSPHFAGPAASPVEIEPPKLLPPRPPPASPPVLPAPPVAPLPPGSAGPPPPPPASEQAAARMKAIATDGARIRRGFKTAPW